MHIEDLRRLVDAGEIDTVVVAMTDMQGRLQGKRLDADFFLDETLQAGTEGCSYLLGVDVDMNTVPGYEITSWEKGYGDFVLTPDLSTLVPTPWVDKTVFCHADLSWVDGSSVVEGPRNILKGQLARAQEHGLWLQVGTELEFLLFQESFEDARSQSYRGLTPANQYNVDYSILGTSRVEPILGRIRRQMKAAGMVVESVKGECNYGQHEIAFRYSEALSKADEHALYKLGAKEIAGQEGMSLSFMAKFNEREGNSCHIHLSATDEEGRSLFAGDDGKRIHGASVLFEHAIAGLSATMRDFALLYAPNINSYKRYVEGSFAPTAIAWGMDNRTCALRVVGHGQSLRVENRVPGGDVNPYLAIGAMVAGVLYGIDNELELDPPMQGNAYVADVERMPTSLGEAMELFTQSAIARSAFSDGVVEHYTNMAQVELDAFGRAVTDWELQRSFERL
ncbi:glutamine synthetase family protein [Ferrimicrobium sp.]|uniref:glutamine synthetase family protein n=1 Tax=Ferrimicrobium sp. TaxID=2926050 RepID=UPI002610D617|nr:glutamine synthetase family protein [Ferrimicrobium sp.]